MHTDWIRRMVEFSEGYDLVSSAIEGETLNGKDARRVATIQPPETFQPPGAVSPILVGCSLICRADAYRQLGGMDVSYAANHDVELGWRAHREGWKVGYLPEALVAYRYRTGIRAGYRQGDIRGLEVARLRQDFPDSGTPDVRLSKLLVALLGLATSWRLAGEEWGLMIGITVGQLRGGVRYRTLRW